MLEQEVAHFYRFKIAFLTGCGCAQEFMMDINNANCVTIQNHDGMLWLQIQEHEIFSEAYCQEIVSKAAENMSENAKLVIDLSKVVAAGSCFFGSLVQIKRAVMDRQGRFAVAQPTKFVEQSMRIAGLNRVFPIATSVEDAKRKLRRAA